MQFLRDIAGRRRRLAPKLSEDARRALLRHDWPGNVRELRNRLERASVLARADVLEPSDLFPETILDDLPPETLADARKQAVAEQIQRALALSQGRVGEAAKRLGISRTTLWKRKSQV
jgi:transcriptional regulator of acetoin/glycerol metabolism